MAYIALLSDDKHFDFVVFVNFTSLIIVSCKTRLDLKKVNKPPTQFLVRHFALIQFTYLSNIAPPFTP